MVKLLRPGRVVVVTAGRFAGKKGIILSALDSSKDHTFKHAVIAGVKMAPRKVHKKMDKKRIEQRSRIKVFLKTLNLNHIMPTRYTVTSELDVNNLTEQIDTSCKAIDEMKKSIKTNRQDESKTLELKTSMMSKKHQLRSTIQKILQEKFLNPVNEKTKKPSKDILFLRKKLRF